DGIRDFHVTGVQTCALPISAWHFFKDWLGIGDIMRAIRQHITELTVQTVTYADLDAFNAIQHIKFGDAKTGNTVDHDGTLHGGADRKSVVEGKRLDRGDWRC